MKFHNIRNAVVSISASLSYIRLSSIAHQCVTFILKIKSKYCEKDFGFFYGPKNDVEKLKFHSKNYGR